MQSFLSYGPLKSNNLFNSSVSLFIFSEFNITSLYKSLSSSNSSRFITSKLLFISSFIDDTLLTVSFKSFNSLSTFSAFSRLFQKLRFSVCF